jgi:hypothetical protein
VTDLRTRVDEIEIKAAEGELLGRLSADPEGRL